MTQPKKPRSRPPRVALLIETSNAYGRGLLRGVFKYVREHAPWFFHLVEQGRGQRPPAWLAEWEGDGVIARIETEAIAQAIRQAGLPTVDVSAGRLVPEVPFVETDDREIARVAAEHLRERGFRSFGYCGDARFRWSADRARAFGASLAAAGLPCQTLEGTRSEDLGGQVEEIAQWLRRLPKPAGIFAGYDVRGVQVLDACRRAALAVPDEVAVLGVDNDELLCEAATPALSSVVPDALGAGYAAAEWLDRLMRGETLGQRERRIRPVGVQQRLSTDAMAIDDPLIVRAVRFIREHACDPIDVSDVLGEVAASRRSFEARFRRRVGRTPHAEILRVRLERVTRLLRETDLPLGRIAERAGFVHEEYLGVVCKRELGEAPGRLRARYRRER